MYVAVYIIHKLRPEAPISSLINFTSTACHHYFVCHYYFISDRSPPSSMTLEALRLRIETRQRARGLYRDQGVGGSLIPPGICEAFGEARRQQTTKGTIDSTYESLMEWQEEVSVNTWKYRCSEARLATLTTTSQIVDFHLCKG